MEQKAEHWQVRNAMLCRTFKFDSFAEAFSFMTQCAFAAEVADHHPNWRNVYNQVEVELTTHDKGAITDKDYDLAEKFNAVFERYSSG